MADLVLSGNTSLSTEEVITRAVQFFSTGKWKVTSQSQRSATFEGKPPIPWFMLLLMIVGLITCVVPGIVLYVMIIRKMYRFVNLVVTANPIPAGTDVTISHPAHAKDLVQRFLTALPPVTV